MHVEEIHMVNEATFGDLVTYPTITTVVNRRADRPTRVNLRDGRSARVRFPTDGRSWLPPILSPGADNGRIRLNDICLRVSCGVATGADSVFIRKTSALSPELAPFAYPTISGRELPPRKRGLCSLLLDTGPLLAIRKAPAGGQARPPQEIPGCSRDTRAAAQKDLRPPQTLVRLPRNTPAPRDSPAEAPVQRHHRTSALLDRSHRRHRSQAFRLLHRPGGTSSTGGAPAIPQLRPRQTMAPRQLPEGREQLPSPPE